MPVQLTPEVGIPLPFDTQPEEIPLWRDRAKALVATLHDIVSLGGEVEVTQEDRMKARQAIADDKPIKITEKNAGQLLHLEALLSEYDKDLINVSARLRSFVTNKILLETMDEDAKVRLKALELLGKITSVGLFSDRIEVDVRHRSIEEIDNELQVMLEKYMGAADQVPKTETEEEVNSLLSMTDEEIGIPPKEENSEDAAES